MHKFQFSLPLLAILVLTVMLGVSSWNSPGTLVPLQNPTATAAMPPMGTGSQDEKSWIIVDLPPDATQLEYGAEVYRLVCKACHGDKGQGLTDDWRAQWAPEDQNCWRSKCHAANHPPDGFYMPISPAVVGPPLKIFDTALDLYNFIHTKMPWHDPGSMTKKDSWSVTAYILKINSIDPGPDLNPGTASQIFFHGNNILPASSVPEAATDSAPTHDIQNKETNSVSSVWIVAVIVAIALIFAAIFILSRRPTH